MLYTFAKNLFLIFVKLWFRWHVTGRENLPKEGPVVVVANHVSLWDPIILGIALPRKVHYMTKEELFRIPVLGMILPHLGAFPVKRGKSDRAALKAGLDILAGGKMLGLFPEGTRSLTGELKEFQAGAGLMAVKGNAPVVPVAIKGTLGLKLGFKRKVTVVVGKPVQMDDFQDKKRFSSRELTAAMDNLKERIAAMLKTV